MIFAAPKIFSQKLQLQKDILIQLQTPANPTSAILLINKNMIKMINPTPVLSPNYYAIQLGFFCKQEIKFEKIAKIPFKFRMGSIEDCDRLEGKRKNY